VIVQVIAIKDVTVTAKINSLNMTPEEAQAFIRKIMGPPKRVLEGTEREHMLTVLRLVEPIRSTNNQRSFTDEYVHAGKMYDVHYFEGETVVEEYLDEES
jgi:hypothetical protein